MIGYRLPIFIDDAERRLLCGRCDYLHRAIGPYRFFQPFRNSVAHGPSGPCGGAELEPVNVRHRKVASRRSRLDAFYDVASMVV